MDEERLIYSKFPPGEYLLYSKVSGGRFTIQQIFRADIVSIPGEGLLCGRFTIRHRNRHTTFLNFISMQINGHRITRYFRKNSSLDLYFSLLRQTSSYVQRCEIFLSCTSARQRNHARFTDKCMVYSLCQLPAQFAMLFLFKINNSLYINFQSFINTQILTISHIIT